MFFGRSTSKRSSFSAGASALEQEPPVLARPLQAERCDPVARGEDSEAVDLRRGGQLTLRQLCASGAARCPCRARGDARKPLLAHQIVQRQREVLAGRPDRRPEGEALKGLGDARRATTTNERREEPSQLHQCVIKVANERAG